MTVGVPELPEVESARQVIERGALDRRITEVDDTDTFVCRPHRPGEIRDALLGRRLVAVGRRGKSMWCETSPTARHRTPGPTMGIHLGMSGKIVIAGADGSEVDGGDYWDRGRRPGDHGWARFSVTFADGGRMLLVDPRRLGRVRLDPAIEALGPDAATVSPAAFRELVSRSRAPVKARLLDQHAIAGIGNLLADEILWLARINPGRPADELTRDDLDRLLRASRRAVKAALRDGGVHTLTVVKHRKAGDACPRDGAPMVRSTVGGRTSWWCEREQAS